MKKLSFLFIAVLCFASSCNSFRNISEKHISTISFYNYNGDPISLEEIRSNWNNRLQDDEHIPVNIEEIQIVTTTDEGAKEEKIVLMAFSDDRTVKTAAEIFEFKKGYQLSNRTITCNCSADLQPEIFNGNWTCNNSSEDHKDCTKIDSMIISMSN